MRLLLAEDEKALSRALVKIFEKNNYSVEAVFDGEEAINYIEYGNFGVAVLDVMMPKADGITVLKKIREKGCDIPVLMLTAKSEIEDRVLGLDCGANDYLTKPFDTRELLARIRSITRSKNEIDSSLTMGNISLDRSSFELKGTAGSIKLANKEYQLMEMFLTNPRRVISTEQIMEKIWGYESEAEINVVWVNISNLRKKLKSLSADVEIKASRNAGYSLEDCHD